MACEAIRIAPKSAHPCDARRIHDSFWQVVFSKRIAQPHHPITGLEASSTEPMHDPSVLRRRRNCRQCLLHLCQFVELVGGGELIGESGTKGRSEGVWCNAGSR